jgi:hypothetical protein
MKKQKIPLVNKKIPELKTGPLQIGDNPTGVYLRNESALWYAGICKGMSLRIKEGEPFTVNHINYLEEMMEIFLTCYEPPKST